MRDIIIDTIVLALISSLFIASGLRLLLAKRPFIAGGRWWGILWIAPMMLNWINILLSEYAWQNREFAFFAYMGTGCMAILLGVILWEPGGGMVIGASGTTLRDALRQAFSRLSLSYEESAKAFRLPALNNELYAQAPLDGVFFLRFKRLRGLRAMRQLARQLDPEVKEFFKTAPVRINKRLGYALVVIGVAFLLLDSLVTYERLSLRARMRSLDEAHTEFFEPSEK
ncbi:MAG TPA: hypothetical protein VFS27_05055 [Blastocatellia bacterium]|jgi:hypothetical protein|nr:hypothetical protein [Blastocatellia bacterium]